MPSLAAASSPGLLRAFSNLPQETTDLSGCESFSDSCRHFVATPGGKHIPKADRPRPMGRDLIATLSQVQIVVSLGVEAPLDRVLSSVGSVDGVIRDGNSHHTEFPPNTLTKRIRTASLLVHGVPLNHATLGFPRFEVQDRVLRLAHRCSNIDVCAHVNQARVVGIHGGLKHNVGLRVHDGGCGRRCGCGPARQAGEQANLTVAHCGLRTEEPSGRWTAGPSARGRPIFDETPIAALSEPMPLLLIGCLRPTNPLFVP